MVRLLSEERVAEGLGDVSSAVMAGLAVAFFEQAQNEVPREAPLQERATRRSELAGKRRAGEAWRQEHCGRLSSWSRCGKAKSHRLSGGRCDDWCSLRPVTGQSDNLSSKKRYRLSSAC